MNERTAEFDRFWTTYPRRIGKLAAIKAFQKARVTATLDDILRGVERYKRHKPEYADFCHPSTFLSQGRWMDEYDEPIARAQFPDCDHTPRCNSKQWCAVVRQRERESA